MLLQSSLENQVFQLPNFRLTGAKGAAIVRVSMRTAKTIYTLMRPVAINVARRNRVASWHVARKQEEFI